MSTIHREGDVKGGHTMIIGMRQKGGHGEGLELCHSSRVTFHQPSERRGCSPIPTDSKRENMNTLSKPARKVFHSFHVRFDLLSRRP